MGYSHLHLLEFVKDASSVVSLMCGKGDDLKDVSQSKRLIGVDIYAPYLSRVVNDKVEKVCMDSLEWLEQQKDKSFDVIWCIDGIEHLTKERGLLLIKEMERVAIKRVLFFTPDGYTKNEPHVTWGIPGGDDYQKHLSGWTLKEFEDWGYKCFSRTQFGGSDQNGGVPYHAILVFKEL